MEIVLFDIGLSLLMSLFLYKLISFVSSNSKQYYLLLFFFLVLLYFMLSIFLYFIFSKQI